MESKLILMTANGGKTRRHGESIASLLFASASLSFACVCLFCIFRYQTPIVVDPGIVVLSYWSNSTSIVAEVEGGVWYGYDVHGGAEKLNPAWWNCPDT